MSDLDQQGLQSQGVSQDADAYINYYGLTGDPFNPENALFFTSAQLEKLLRLFNYLARFSRKLVVVTGSSGVGKTTLLENFVNQQSEQDLVCFFSALSSDSPKQVLFEIAEQLEVPHCGEQATVEQLVSAIRDYSLECQGRDHYCMVVIDDAHLFDVTVLKQLYQLAVHDPEHRSAISFLLSGQPELLSHVQGVVPAEASEKTLFHQQLAPLSFDEVIQYLQMYFSENAGQNKPPFSQLQYQKIFEQSEGIPGRINETTTELLTAGMAGLLDNPQRTDKKSKNFVGLLVTILVLIGAGFFWWQINDQPLPSDDLANQNMVGQIVRAVELPADEEELPSEQIFADPEVVIEVESPEQTLQNSEISEQQTAGVDDSLESNATATVAENLPGKVLEPLKSTVESSGPEQLVNKRQVATHSLADKVLEEEPAVERVSPIVSQLTEATRLEQDTARILAVTSTDYTMQLLGSHKEESIQTMLAKMPDDNNLMYFKKTHKGAPWYVLIYGHYAGRSEANAAAQQLPAALKGVKPWIRRVSAIQETIKANQ